MNDQVHIACFSETDEVLFKNGVIPEVFNPQDFNLIRGAACPVQTFSTLPSNAIPIYPMSKNELNSSSTKSSNHQNVNKTPSASSTGFIPPQYTKRTSIYAPKLDFAAVITPFTETINFRARKNSQTFHLEWSEVTGNLTTNTDTLTVKQAIGNKPEDSLYFPVFVIIDGVEMFINVWAQPKSHDTINFKLGKIYSVNTHICIKGGHISWAC